MSCITILFLCLRTTYMHAGKHHASSKMVCQPGDCRCPLLSSSKVCVGIYGLTYHEENMILIWFVAILSWKSVAWQLIYTCTKHLCFVQQLRCTYACTEIQCKKILLYRTRNLCIHIPFELSLKMYFQMCLCDHTNGRVLSRTESFQSGIICIYLENCFVRISPRCTLTITNSS